MAITQKAVDILNNYFDKITFVDDKFDINYEFISPIGEIEAKTIKQSFDPAANYFSDSNYTEESSSESDFYTPDPPSVEQNIFNLLNLCKKENLNIFPYTFSEGDSTKNISDYLSKSKMVILDWKLSDTNTTATIEILKNLSEQSGLKYVIIYTNEPSEVIFNAIMESFSSAESTSDKFFKINSIFLTIASKKESNLKEILENFNKNLIKNYGHFFISFFDVNQQISSKTNEVLSQFMNPFESLLLLQLRNSEIDEDDYSEPIKRIVLNHVSDNIIINSEIIEGLKNTARDTFSKLRNKNKKAFIEDLKNVVNFSNLNTDVLNELNDLIDDSKLKKLMNICLKRNPFLDNSNRTEVCNDNIDEFCKSLNLSAMSTQFLKDNFLLLLFLSTSKTKDSLKTNIINLLKLIKFMKYDLSLNDLLNPIIQNININKDDENFYRKLNPALLNKFKPGDIFIKDDEFLLCITPPCDAFRPYKTDYHLKYLVGKREDFSLSKVSADKWHYSIIPDDDNIYTVKWFFYNEKVINVSNVNDLNTLKEYKRPFRLQEQYLKEIMSRYIAFWNRSGVDEVFLKSEKHTFGLALNNILLNN